MWKSVEQHIDLCYEVHDRSRASSLLKLLDLSLRNKSCGPHKRRSVQRAAIRLSYGKIDGLVSAVDMAQVDYHRVIELAKQSKREWDWMSGWPAGMISAKAKRSRLRCRYKIGRVEVGISEPWEARVFSGFGYAGKRALYIDQHYNCTVNCVLVQIETPFVYKETECEYFVCSPRHAGSSVDDIWGKRLVDFAIQPITQETAQSARWFDTTEWRGGVAFIGSIKIA